MLYRILPEEEGFHTPGEGDNWQESAVLAWRDEASGLGGHHRIGTQGNLGTSNLWCGVFLGRHTAYKLELLEVPLQMVGTGHGLTCGPQRIYHDGTNLRLELDTPECVLRLIIEDLAAPPERIHKGKKSMEEDVYSDHFNRHCRVRGEVILAGQRHTVGSGLGWRDHSYGRRRWGYAISHRGFHGNFGDDLDFHLLSVLGTDGKWMRRGIVHYQGNTFEMETFRIAVDMMEDGISPLGVRALITLPHGETIRLVSRMQRGVLAQVSAYGFYGVGDCRWGNRTDGLGDLEMHENAMNGKGPPLLVQDALLENGLSYRDEAAAVQI